MFTTGKKIQVLSIAAVMTVATTGCGKGGFGGLVSNVSVQTYQYGGDLWGELKAQLSTLGMVIAGLNIPIVDPQSGATLGQISINNSFCGSASCGGSELDIQFDISKLSHSSTALLNTLPNGTPIPVGGLGNTPIIGIPIGGSGAQLYVGLGQSVAMLGIALPFAEFNQIGQYVPGVDLFEPFASGKLNGVVGLFTGHGAGQNGIALFVDASSLLNSNAIQAMSIGNTVAPRFSAHALSANVNANAQQPAPGRLIMQTQNPANWKKYFIYQMMDQLDRRGAVLHMH